MSEAGRLALVAVGIYVLTSCGSAPKYIPPDGPGALLQNRLVETGNTRFFYFFEIAGSKLLEPTGINKAELRTRAIFKTNSPYDATYKIRPGATIVGVRVVYTPAFGRNVFARMNDLYYHIFVRDMGISDEQIAYLGENVPDAEPHDFSGMQGLEFVAQERHTYQINSRIHNGRASVWIEELDGTIVSQTVTGFGDANSTIHGALGDMIRTSPYIDKDNLPDPKYGWGILTDLPTPPN